MSIWLDQTSKVIVQGMTGSEGGKHTRRMIASGTRIVGGVTPGKGGQAVTFEERPVPVFDTVAQAKEATGANVSVIFVPAPRARAAVIEAVDAELDLAVVITEGVPVADTVDFVAYTQGRGSTRLIGPNCPGLISPGKSNVGIIPATIAAVTIFGAGRPGTAAVHTTTSIPLRWSARRRCCSARSSSVSWRA